MLRVAAGVRAPLRWTSRRCYSEGGFEIADYLSRIEAITKSRKPSQSRGQGGPGKRHNGPSQQRASRPAQQARGRREPVKGAPAKSGPTAGSAPRSKRQDVKRVDGKASTQVNVRPRAQASALNASRSAGPTARASQHMSGNPAKGPATVSAEGFIPLSTISQEPLPKGGRRPGAGSRAPRTRAKGARKPRSTQRTSEAALLARRSLQVTKQDTSFLSPSEGLEILMRNENSTVNGYISIGDVSLQALQPSLVTSAVSYNSRVRSLLRDLPSDVVADRERLNALVREHVQGSYDEGVVLEARGGNISTDSLVKVLNANPTLTGETRKYLASVANGKVPIKQIARSA